MRRSGNCGVVSSVLDLSAGEDRFRRELCEVGRPDDAGNMVAMFVREDDGARAAQRLVDLLRLLGEVGFLGAAANLLVHRQVHARVDHHVSVGIDHLEHRSRLDARRCGLTFDREVLGPMALRKLEHVDAQRLPSRE